MKPKKQNFIAHITLGLFLTLGVTSGECAANVFDMPFLNERHFQLLAVMNHSHAQQLYKVMESACREGLALGSDDALWAYNLACALALQGMTNEALENLQTAMESGFLDAAHTAQDTDLTALRLLPGFKTLLARMSAWQESVEKHPRQVEALGPDVNGVIPQCASNTLWSFEYGIFHTLVAMPSNATDQTYHGPCAELMGKWLAEGSASGASGILYVNRDDNENMIAITNFPGLCQLGYDAEVTKRKLANGASNTLFVDPARQVLVPTIGHSAMGFMTTAFWRSLPRAISSDPRLSMLQPVMLLGNQLFFYNSLNDYTLEHGDLFTVNNPCIMAVAGTNGCEQLFAKAAIAAIAAMRPPIREELMRRKRLMPTLNVLFRATQKQLTEPQQYFTGAAHPAVFQSQNLDEEKLIRAAHALTTNDIPPVIFLKMLGESQMVAGRDFFDDAQLEQLFDTPFCIARVFRGAARTRGYELEVATEDHDVSLHWTLLQGNPELVLFTPCPTNAMRMTIHVAHHVPYEKLVDNEQKIRTTRVDIGVIGQRGASVSMPAILSIYFLANERRTYAHDGRILSIDYTWPQEGYTDPMLSLSRNWRDEYHYNSAGAMTGWLRVRGLQKERFTPYGHRVVASDAIGRATKAHLIRYMQRKIRSEAGESELPDLAQVDDNIEVTYHYTSDSDFTGKPKSTLH